MSSILALTDGGAARVVEAAAAAAPAVVLFPAIAGINPYIEGIQAKLAERGYTVAAIDYWARDGGAPAIRNTEEAMAAVARVADLQVLADATEVVDALGAPRIGLLGYCIGGTMSFLAASAMAGAAAAVSYYGLIRYPNTSETKPTSPIDRANDIAVPFLGHWGKEDKLIPMDDIRALEQLLVDKPAEIYAYPGAGHAFDEHMRPEVHRPVAAADAWRRTGVFLDWHLLSR